MLKEKTYQPRILYAAKYSFKSEGYFFLDENYGNLSPIGLPSKKCFKRNSPERLKNDIGQKLGSI